MREHKKRANIHTIITSHIINNYKEYLSVILILLIGIVIGVIALNNINNEHREEIQTYIEQFIGKLHDNQNIDKTALLKNVAINNLIIILGLWFMGSTVIGIPIVYSIILYKGFCLGYTISSIIAVLSTGKGLLFALTSIFLQNLIYIPCMLALAVSGIRLYKSIIKDKRKENIKLEILRHILFSAFIGSIFLLGSFVEVYFSTNLMLAISNFIWKICKNLKKDFTFWVRFDITYIVYVNY